MKNKDLIVRTETLVRFSEIDSMGVVWHGNYVKYLEDGREAFGNKYGLNYLDFFNNGILTPLVKLTCDFKQPLIYGDKAVIEIKYIDCKAAKLIYEYIIYRHSDNEVIATAESMQVFLDTKHELILTIPDFFYKWKKKWGLVD